MASYGYESERQPVLRSIVRASEEAPMSPAAAYTMYYNGEENGILYPPVYFVSTAHRSGGYLRDPRLDLTNPESAQRAKLKNLKVAGLLLKQLAKDNSQSIRREAIVIPTELDGVRDWQLPEYIRFWGYVLSGINPGQAERVETQYTDGWRTSNAAKLTATPNVMRDDRMPYYQYIQGVYTDISFERNDEDKGPSTILELVDTHGSAEGIAGNQAAFQLRKSTVRALLDQEKIGENSHLRQKLDELARCSVKVDSPQTATHVAVVDLWTDS